MCHPESKCQHETTFTEVPVIRDVAQKIGLFYSVNKDNSLKNRHLLNFLGAFQTIIYQNAIAP